MIEHRSYLADLEVRGDQREIIGLAVPTTHPPTSAPTPRSSSAAHSPTPPHIRSPPHIPATAANYP
jgi:hypothetical protein